MKILVKVDGYHPAEYISTQRRGKKEYVYVRWSNIQRRYNHGFWEKEFPKEKCTFIYPGVWGWIQIFLDFFRK